MQAEGAEEDASRKNYFGGEMKWTSSPSRNGFGLARGKCEELHDGEEGIVMPSKKYVLKLSTEERGTLGEVIRQPRSARWKVVRRVLLD